MTGLEAIYDAAFFKEWGRLNDDYCDTARHVAQVVYDEFKPKRMVDFGAGCGVYADFFRRKGVDVVALDGVVCPPEYAFPGEVHIRDFTVPFKNEWGTFDMALCLEVAEHLHDEDADTFVENLIQFAPRIALSAAPPNQGGTHHVNEQPKRYWKAKLEARGFYYDRPATGRMFERFRIEKLRHMWMGSQVSVYVNEEPPNAKGRRVAGATSRSRGPGRAP